MKKKLFVGLLIIFALGATQAYVVEQKNKKLAAAEAIQLEADNYMKNGDSLNALKFTLDAAEMGNSESQNKLGLLYRDGLILNKNIEEAIYWFRLSAEQRNVNGLYNLAKIYKDKDEQMEANYWFNLAYQYGDSEIRKKIDKDFEN